MADALRVVVAEDEPFNRRRLVRLLSESGCDVVCACEDGAELLAWFQAGGRADAAFLDIQMPLLGGLEASADLPAGVAVVFVTAHAEHAARAFETEACDYLLKPVNAQRLARALERIRARTTAVAAPATTGRGPARVPVKAGDGIVLLDFSRITHFTLEDELVWAWAGDRFRTLYASLADVEQALAGRGLLRAGRAALLRPQAVVGVRTLDNGRMLARLAGGQELEVSRGAAPRLKEALGLPAKGRTGG